MAIITITPKRMKSQVDLLHDQINKIQQGCSHRRYFYTSVVTLESTQIPGLFMGIDQQSALSFDGKCARCSSYMRLSPLFICPHCLSKVKFERTEVAAKVCTTEQLDGLKKLFERYDTKLCSIGKCRKCEFRVVYIYSK